MYSRRASPDDAEPSRTAASRPVKPPQTKRVARPTLALVTLPPRDPACHVVSIVTRLGGMADLEARRVTAGSHNPSTGRL